MPEKFYRDPAIKGSRYVRRTEVTQQGVARNHPTWVEVDPDAPISRAKKKTDEERRGAVSEPDNQSESE
jgi:hypothetical protein